MELFRPDDELKKLAKLAVRARRRRRASKTGSVDAGARGASRARPRRRRTGSRRWEEAQDPWFNFTSGNGFYATDKYWIEHQEIPLGYIKDYIARVRARRGDRAPDRGSSPPSATASPRSTRDLLERRGPRGLRRQARPGRTVFPYVENHNFYIEHWTMGVFWRKMRELSRMLHEAGFWDAAGRHVLPDAATRSARRSSTTATAGRVGADADRPRATGRRRSSAAARSSTRWRRSAPQPALNTPPE